MDIKLSKRMKNVVEFVEGEKVCDIGCDHAFVSIYLLQHNLAKKVYAMDVRKGPLEIAKSHVNACGFEQLIDVRLSDGFEKLEVGEADCAIIAGMGGPLIVEILKRGKAHTDKGINLVLQPQSDIYKVREYLYDIGYAIEKENMLIDEEKYYTVIKAKKINDLSKKPDKPSQAEFTYGKYLIENKNDILKQFLEEKLEKNREIRKKLIQNSSEKSYNRTIELESENKLIEEVLECNWRD